MTTGVRRALTVLSLLEMASVAALLINVVTIDARAVPVVLGPVHGMLYLSVVSIAVLGRGLTTAIRVGAVFPVLSGPLTLINIRRARAGRDNASRAFTLSG